MDYKLLKKIAETINMPEGLADEILQNCQSLKRKRGSVKRGYRLVAASLVLVILTTVLAIWKPWQEVSVYATDLMEGVVANPVESKEADEAWIQAVADFSVELFQKGQTTNENSLISPLSVYLALAMAANGAGGETLEAFEQVLGDGISLEDINVQAYSLLSRLCYENQETLKINNSVWFDKRRCGNVYSKFIQKNADYYRADAFQLNFSNESKSLEQMNQWVADKLQSDDNEMVKELETDAAMLLINTILFESKWKTTYYDPIKAPFQNADDTWVKTYMLKGEKQYIENENATGFISPYKDERFSFVALLPNEGTSLDEYVANLTGEEFLDIVNLESEKTCLSYLPEFSYNYENELSGALKNMGLEAAFSDNSDFSNLSNKGKGIYIGKVEHQTFIQLDTEGTKAGAVTVEKLFTRGGERTGGHYVFLNRPFLYAIIDNETKLPVFLGTVNQLAGEAIEAPVYSSVLEEHNGVTYRIVTNSENFAAIANGSEGEKIVDINWYDSPQYVLTYIEPYAYANFEMLEEVHFRLIDNAFTIGKNAFADCPNLKKVIFHANKYGYYFDATIEEGAFEGSEQVVFYMPTWFATEKYSAQVYLYAQEHNIPVEFYTETAE